MTIAGTHDSMLIVLSILIAMAASYTALDLASRLRASTGWARLAWLATAALAMGGGIWAMHFVAMLAFSMPGMEVAYDPWLTLLSLALAGPASQRPGPPPPQKQKACLQDIREDRRDRMEDKRDRAEDVRDARRFTGPADLREDIRDRREDRRDRAEDRYDRNHGCSRR